MSSTARTTLHQDGYIMLTAVLLIGLVMGTAVVTTATFGSFAGLTSTSYGNKQQASNLLESCIFDALLTIQQDDSFTGTQTITFPEGSCNLTITSGTPWSITAETDYQRHTSTATVHFNRTASIEILKWTLQ